MLYKQTVQADRRCNIARLGSKKLEREKAAEKGNGGKLCLENRSTLSL
jgi:hypothetical protein